MTWVRKNAAPSEQTRIRIRRVACPERWRRACGSNGLLGATDENVGARVWEVGETTEDKEPRRLVPGARRTGSGCGGGESCARGRCRYLVPHSDSSVHTPAASRPLAIPSPGVTAHNLTPGCTVGPFLADRPTWR